MPNWGWDLCHVDGVCTLRAAIEEANRRAGLTRCLQSSWYARADYPTRKSTPDCDDAMGPTTIDGYPNLLLRQHTTLVVANAKIVVQLVGTAEIVLVP
jgi:hypothetical protein